MRAVSIVEVAREGLWAPLEAAVGAEAFAEHLSPTRRVVTDTFDAAVSSLSQLGIRILVRHARRTHEEIASAQADLSRTIDRLPPRTRTVLWRAASHARDGVVLGSHVWDPLEEAPCVRELHGAGLIRALPDLSLIHI